MKEHIEAAEFWIEAAHRLGLNKPETDLADPKALDDAFRRLYGPNKGTVPSQSVSPMLIRFLYSFEPDLAAFIDDHLDQKLDAEAEQIATLLIESWPGLPALIEELKAIDRDYLNSPQYQRTLDLIRHWDLDASREDNIARRHLRITTPKTSQ